MKYLKQLIVYQCIFIFNLTCLFAPAHATILGTDAIIADQSRQQAESKIAATLARDDVANTLVRLGVSANEVQDRVAALSDEEIMRLSDRIERMPAGGDFFGTVGVIFVILLITDILGFTKIFPFTRAQR